MIIRQSTLLVGSVSALVLVLSCSLPASARLAGNRVVANRLASNRLAANSLSDRTKFDTQAVNVSKITLPDGTILTVR